MSYKVTILNISDSMILAELALNMNIARSLEELKAQVRKEIESEFPGTKLEFEATEDYEGVQVLINDGEEPTPELQDFLMSIEAILDEVYYEGKWVQYTDG